MLNFRPFGFLRFVLVLGSPSMLNAQDASLAAGERLFRSRCAICHAVEEGQKRTGPHLDGVIGRRAASVEDVNYSDALRGLGVVWDAENLEQFLANPVAMAKGTRMTIRVANASDRASIVAYLGSLAAK
jgi:cytochrome c